MTRDPDGAPGGQVGERAVQLTPREAGVLSWLMAHADQPVSRRTLLREVWGYRGARSTRVVDMTVARLRRKIEPDPAAPTHLLTVHGLGYRYAGARIEPPALMPGDTAPGDHGLAAVVAQLGVFGERAPRAAVTSVVDWPESTRALGPWGALQALLQLGMAREDGDELVLPGAADAFRVLPTATRQAISQRRARWAVSLRGEAAQRWAARIDAVVEEALAAGDLGRVREGLEALASVGPGAAPLAAARLALHEGRLRDAEERFRAALPEPAALAGLGWSCNLRGDNREAQRHLQALAEVATGPLAVRAHTDLAVCAVETGAGDRAWGHVERATAHAASIADPIVMADVLMTHGYVALMLELADRALPPIREAEQLYRGIDEPRGVAWALNNLGEAQRLRGDRAAASRCYQQSLEWFRAAGCANLIVPLANLGLLDLQAGLGGDKRRLDRAVTRFETARARARAEGRFARAGRSALLLARARWALGDSAGARSAADEATDALARVDFFERLVAREAEALGEALGPTMPETARGLVRLAVRQWRGLGRPEEAARVAEQAEAFGGAEDDVQT